MDYNLYILPQARKDLDSLQKKFFNQLKKKILSLKSNPRPRGCLKLTAEEGYRLRTGKFRILYRVDDKNRIVYIYRIKHRKEAYI
jgi:mRNA interferase RelE/StbE